MTKSKITFTSLAFIIIMVISFKKYRSYQFEIYKSEVINELEEYHSQNKTFPKSLHEISAGEDFNLHYVLDTINDSYRLSYLSGLMDLNLNYFESKTKKWKTEYTE